MRRMLCLGTVCLVGLLGLAPAVAQDEAAEDEIGMSEAEAVTGQLESFDAIDRNSDGSIDWEEIRNQVTKIFYDTDANGDRSLSMEEFSFGEDHWKLADINENGQVDLHELVAHAAKVFGTADTDGDDVLSREEAKIAKEKEGLN